MVIKRSAAVTFLSVCVVIAACAAASAAVTEADLKARVEAASANLEDFSATGNVVYKDAKVLASVNESFARIYEFKSVSLMFKSPDKLRFEGKLGMVKFDYIINGGLKIVRAPAVKMNRTKDYSHQPSKLQEPLDLGIITPLMWRGRTVEILEDPESESRGELKIRLKWTQGTTQYTAWIDAQDLWLKRIERLNGDGVVTEAVVYSNPVHMGDVVWMPTRAELHTADGRLAAAIEFVDIQVNKDLEDSLFK